MTIQKCECSELGKENARYHGGNAAECPRVAATELFGSTVVASPALCTPCLFGCTELEEPDGCECTTLCSMGPTCPGGMLAGVEGSGCWRTEEQVVEP